MSQFIYTANLVPVGKPVRIPFVDGRPSDLSTFTDESFEIERTAKTKPPVLVNHDKGLQVGRVVALSRSLDGWWCADFVCDDVPDDITFEVGQPVSVGIHQSITGSGGTFLDEVSIVRTGAVKGAEITRRWAYEPKPAEAPRTSAAVPSSSDRAAAADVIPIRRTARGRSTTFPRSEFERRMDFATDLAENFGIHGAVEAELEHMQRLERAMQLGRMPPSLLRGVR